MASWSRFCFSAGGRRFSYLLADFCCHLRPVQEPQQSCIFNYLGFQTSSCDLLGDLQEATLSSTLSFAPSSFFNTLFEALLVQGLI